MLHGSDLFCGEEVRSVSEKHPFQSNQCERIFSIMGLPSIYDWPELKTCRYYSRIARWGFDKQMAQTSSLRQYIAPVEGDAFSFWLRVICREVFDLLTKLLTLNPEKRITAKAALSHPFFQNHLDILSVDALPARETRQFPTPQKAIAKVPLDLHLPDSPSSGVQLQYQYVTPNWVYLFSETWNRTLIGILNFDHSFDWVHFHNGDTATDHSSEFSRFSRWHVLIIDVYITKQRRQLPRRYSTASSRTRFIKESYPFSTPTTMWNEWKRTDSYPLFLLESELVPFSPHTPLYWMQPYHEQTT